ELRPRRLRVERDAHEIHDARAVGLVGAANLDHVLSSGRTILVQPEPDPDRLHRPGRAEKPPADAGERTTYTLRDPDRDRRRRRKVHGALARRDAGHSDGGNL